MLFHVRMDVNIPLDMPAETASEIKAVEKAYSQELQTQGKWRHIWRITGQYCAKYVAICLEFVALANMLFRLL